MSEKNFRVKFIPADDMGLRERKKQIRKRKATLDQVVEEFRQALHRWETAEGLVVAWSEVHVESDSSNPNSGKD